MKLRGILLGLLLLCAAGVVAQVATGVVVGFDRGGMSGIKGVPFAADTVTETTRTLADGNRIHTETHGKIYRDSEGRTRTESELSPPIPDAPKWEHVTIVDPVQQEFIHLDPRTRTAQVTHFHRPPTDASPIVAPKQVPLNDKPPAQHRLRMEKPESLGTNVIEGLTVTGTRYTHTMEAGAMGNDKPIVSTVENWFSPELKETVLTKSVHPEAGETVRKLVNIQRVEPDPLLFQVPPDYNVKENNP